MSLVSKLTDHGHSPKMAIRLVDGLTDQARSLPGVESVGTTISDPRTGTSEKLRDAGAIAPHEAAEQLGIECEMVTRIPMDLHSQGQAVIDSAASP